MLHVNINHEKYVYETAASSVVLKWYPFHRDGVKLFSSTFSIIAGTNERKSEQTNRSKVKAESKWKKNTLEDLLELFIINVGGKVVCKNVCIPFHRYLHSISIMLSITFQYEFWFYLESRIFNALPQTIDTKFSILWNDTRK